MLSIASISFPGSSLLSNFLLPAWVWSQVSESEWGWQPEKKKPSGFVALIGKKTSLAPLWIIHSLAYGVERKAQWSLHVCLCSFLISSVAHNAFNWACCCSFLQWLLHSFSLGFSHFNLIWLLRLLFYLFMRFCRAAAFRAGGVWGWRALLQRAVEMSVQRPSLAAPFQALGLCADQIEILIVVQFAFRLRGNIVAVNKRHHLQPSWRQELSVCTFFTLPTVGD